MDPWKLVSFRLPPEAIAVMDVIARQIDPTEPSRSAVIIHGLVATTKLLDDDAVNAATADLVNALELRARDR